MVKRTNYCYKRWHTDGFAHLAPRANQMRLPFDNDIESTAFAACVPPPLHGRVEAAPRPQVLKPCIFESDNQDYRITDLDIYAACSAVALIVVELRPGRYYCDAHTHLYIGCCY